MSVPFILYDITRLLARHNAVTPTGIDRVDLRYALFFLRAEKFDVMFVHQKEMRFHLANRSVAVDLLKALERRWLLSDRKSFESLTNIYKKMLAPVLTHSKKIKLPVKLKKFFARILKKPTPTFSVDAALVRFLLQNRSRSVLYFNCSHHGVGNADAYNAFKGISNVGIVFYLHDLIPLDYPEYVRDNDEKTHEKRVSAMAHFGDLVLVNSNSTKDRFNDFCHRHKLVPPKTVPLWIGVEESFRKNESDMNYNSLTISESSYFVTLSTIEPRKNFMLLLQVWRKLHHDLAPGCPKLVIIGKRGWNIDSVTDMLDHCPALADSVVELNGLDDKLLISVLRNATALLAPSFCEGWGMPLVESMSLGTPVICSDIPAHHECTQELAQFLDPLSGDSWYRKIRKTTESANFCRKERLKLKEFSPPTWEAHFEQLNVHIEDLLKDQRLWVPVKDHEQHWQAYQNLPRCAGAHKQSGGS